MSLAFMTPHIPRPKSQPKGPILMQLKHARLNPDDLALLELPEPAALVFPISIRGLKAQAQLTVLKHVQHPQAHAGTAHWQDLFLRHIDAAVAAMLQLDLSSYDGDFDFGSTGNLYRIGIRISYVSDNTGNLSDNTLTTEMSDNTPDPVKALEVSDTQRNPTPAPTSNAFRANPVLSDNVRTGSQNQPNVSRLRR